MSNLEELVRRVSTLTQIECSPASEEDLQTLRELGAPNAVVAFYAKYEPARGMEYGPSIDPISEIEESCDSGSAASAAFEAGFLPFGTEMNGDPLCFDPTKLDENGWPAILRIDHGTVFDDSSRKQVLAGASMYCANLPALLEMMLANSANQLATFATSEPVKEKAPASNSEWTVWLLKAITFLVALSVVIATIAWLLFERGY